MQDIKRYFLKRKADCESTTPISIPSPTPSIEIPVRPRVEVSVPSNPMENPINIRDLPVDPGKRRSIYEFNPNDRENIRRFYLQKKPCQPIANFPWRQFGNEKRRFIFNWFKKHPSWLEYSILEDSAYCLFCYLYKPDCGGQSGGDAFVGEGFTNWKQALKRFNDHVGDHSSIHNKCAKACQDLMNQKQHVDISLSNQTKQVQLDYHTRLVATIDVIKLCLRQALAFRGHDESKESLKRGNFLTILEFLTDHNEEVKKVVLDRAPENNKLTSPKIQKDIINAMALETTSIILQDLGDDLFSILVDESRDISVKEQMVVMLRYIDIKGCIVERFLGVVHVTDTTSHSLKSGVEELLAKHGLSLANVRGQGYDGASNMQGKFNGLKSLILKDYPCAFYVHCFAHQLQLALLGVVKKDRKLAMFFTQINNITNIVAGSCRRQDMLRNKQINEVVEGICSGELINGRGLNQESTLKRAGDTRWGSYYVTLLSFIRLFNPIIGVLEEIADHTDDHDLRGNSELMLMTIKKFDFIFYLLLMKNILGVSNELSKALQKKDQDIINAICLVNATKRLLRNMREDGWESFLGEVTLFCEKHDIISLNMGDKYVDARRVLRRPEELTNLHHYRFDKFNEILDIQIRELHERFGEIGTELLLGMSCLDPRHSFRAFDKIKLMNFTKLYPSDFSPVNIMELEWSLVTYFEDLSNDDRFLQLDGIAGLSKKLVETGKDLIHPLVFKLLKLSMLLPVATASVERSFSAMNIIKTRLRNRIGDDCLNDILVTYIERDVFLKVKDEDIIQRFQNMKSRRVAL